MGDCSNKQSDLMSRDCLGSTNVEIPAGSEVGATAFADSNSYCKLFPDNGSQYLFSDTLIAQNGMINLNPSCLDQNNVFNEPLNLLPTNIYGNVENNFTHLTRSSEERPLSSGRCNTPHPPVPFVLAVVPQVCISNQSLANNSTVSKPTFHSQAPIGVGETSLYYQDSQRVPSLQANRIVEFPHLNNRISGAKENYSNQTDPPATRNFGSVGAELAGIRYGLRNFQSKVNMVRVFPDDRNTGNNLDKTTSCIHKQTELLTQHFNSNFNFKPEDLHLFPGLKPSALPKSGNVDKNNGVLVSSSVHLGGVLTLPKGIDTALDSNSSSQSSSNVSSDKSMNAKDLCNSQLFRQSGIHGCNEIEALISQYNIKSPTINIETFCKSVHRQFNNSKNIMQMEPVMREMILGYLYLSSSWMSLASVLTVTRDSPQPIDNCLKGLTKEFLIWQKKSKTMLDKIIISLKKIPQEHEKYIEGLYKNCSSSSEDSTVFSDYNFSEPALDEQDSANSHCWANNKIIDDLVNLPLNKDVKEIPLKENVILPTNEFQQRNKNKPYKNNTFENVTNSGYKNSKAPGKMFKSDYSPPFVPINGNFNRPRQMILVDSSSYSNDHRFSQSPKGPFNPGSGKKSYPSNRSSPRNKTNSLSPRCSNRRK